MHKIPRPAQGLLQIFNFAKIVTQTGCRSLQRHKHFIQFRRTLNQQIHNAPPKCIKFFLEAKSGVFLFETFRSAAPFAGVRTLTSPRRMISRIHSKSYVFLNRRKHFYRFPIRKRNFYFMIFWMNAFFHRFYPFCFLFATGLYRLFLKKQDF